MTDMTRRQREFLAAAHLASWRTARVFSASIVCQWLDAGDAECRELLRWAEKDGLLSRLPGDEAILTSAGRAAAGDLPHAEGTGR